MFQQFLLATSLEENNTLYEDRTIRKIAILSVFPIFWQENLYGDRTIFSEEKENNNAKLYESTSGQQTSYRELKEIRKGAPNMNEWVCSLASIG